MAALAFTAPHHQAAEIGLHFLQQGANAIDAMVAAAAAISVLYPHMNSIGGDGFWLIHQPGKEPVAIDACGRSAAILTTQYFRDRNCDVTPNRGGEACITFGGTVEGWCCARDFAQRTRLANSIPLSDLLVPAVDLAKGGIKVTETLARASRKLDKEIGQRIHGSEQCFVQYRSVFTRDGSPLSQGDVLANPELAAVLEHLGKAGLEDFYRGDVAATICQGLQWAGSELRANDLSTYWAQEVTPLQGNLSLGTLYNLPPPTQGLASLLILLIYDELYQSSLSEAQRVHILVEATKEAFKIRDTVIADPSKVKQDIAQFLNADSIKKLATNIGSRAQAWPQPVQEGDTIWMGCIDGDGVMVSFIQSLYWEFGSAVVIPDTGIVWNNRGSGFSLDDHHPNALGPSLKPKHTLNPAFCRFNDGSRMVYGTMGGEGQPQTQAAVFTRHCYDGVPLADAIARGRWLLGRTWGESSTDLKVEADLYEEIGAALTSFGHDIAVVPPHSEMMGHAGAIKIDTDGNIECATDPRSDGAALSGFVTASR